jgi:hypothetical protein
MNKGADRQRVVCRKKITKLRIAARYGELRDPPQIQKWPQLVGRKTRALPVNGEPRISET